MARRKPKYIRDAEAASKPEKIPPKQIPADISQHAPHTSYGGVPLFYEDKEFTCVDCGKTEVWTAEQQKWWYETAKGHVYSTAIRCDACREKLRQSHAGTPRKSHRDRREQQEQ